MHFKLYIPFTQFLPKAIQTETHGSMLKFQISKFQQKLNLCWTIYQIKLPYQISWTLKMCSEINILNNKNHQYHYQYVCQIWEQSIQHFLNYWAHIADMVGSRQQADSTWNHNILWSFRYGWHDNTFKIQIIIHYSKEVLPHVYHWQIKPLMYGNI